jgi:hypothetical protein
MSTKRESIIRVVVILVVVIFTQALYIIALHPGNTDYVFGGIFFNPYDGYSYIAKMYQGWEGNWQFHLTYTVITGQGSYLFIFYILLGHISRCLHLSLPLTFHITRMVFTILFYIVLYEFIRKIFVERRHYISAYLLCSLGSGLGWLFLLAGKVTPDFWLSEAYPLLSCFANPHFPIGVSLVILILSDIMENKGYPSAGVVVRNVVLSLCLALVLPFGVVIVITIVTFFLITATIKIRDSQIVYKKDKLSNLFPQYIGILFGGLPVLFYQLWTIRSDVLLSIWNTQNITPLPNIEDLLIAFLPVIFFAVIGGWQVVSNGTTNQRIILIWGLAGIVLAFMPFSLQRRFLMGEYIPLSVLAIIGLITIVQKVSRESREIWFKRGFLSILILSLPSNAILWLITLKAIKSYDPLIYLSRSENEAMNWISTNLLPDATILASPDMSLFIPAMTGRRVLYGHPFETVNAKAEKQFVIDFYSKRVFSQNNLETKETLQGKNIDYLFIGPRERDLAKSATVMMPPAYYKLVYQDTNVSLYQVDP